MYLELMIFKPQDSILGKLCGKQDSKAGEKSSEDGFWKTGGLADGDALGGVSKAGGGGQRQYPHRNVGGGFT